LHRYADLERAGNFFAVYIIRNGYLERIGDSHGHRFRQCLAPDGHGEHHAPDDKHDHA
jgi:hypothetical protein